MHKEIIKLVLIWTALALVKYMAGSTLAEVDFLLFIFKLKAVTLPTFRTIFLWFAYDMSLPKAHVRKDGLQWMRLLWKYLEIQGDGN